MVAPEHVCVHIRSRLATALIVTGSVMFVLGLAVTAVFAPEWRALHVLQALLYATVVGLAWRSSAWGFGLGIFVALFWNGLSIAVTPGTRDAVIEFIRVIGGGPNPRPDLLLALFAFTGHVLIIIGCAFGFARLRPRLRESAQFVGGGVIGLVYLAVIVLTLAPPQTVQTIRRVFGL